MFRDSPASAFSTYDARDSQVLRDSRCILGQTRPQTPEFRHLQSAVRTGCPKYPIPTKLKRHPECLSRLGTRQYGPPATPSSFEPRDVDADNPCKSPPSHVTSAGEWGLSFSASRPLFLSPDLAGNFTVGFQGLFLRFSSFLSSVLLLLISSSV